MANLAPIPLKTPPGGEHRRPPTLGAFVIKILFWQVLGVLGYWRKCLEKSSDHFLGILAKNLEKIIPESSQMEPRGLQNRARGLQNRARSPPRRHF